MFVKYQQFLPEKSTFKEKLRKIGLSSKNSLILAKLFYTFQIFNFESDPLNIEKFLSKLAYLYNDYWNVNL